MSERQINERLVLFLARFELGHGPLGHFITRDSHVFETQSSVKTWKNVQCVLMLSTDQSLEVFSEEKTRDS